MLLSPLYDLPGLRMTRRGVFGAFARFVVLNLVDALLELHDATSYRSHQTWQAVPKQQQNNATDYDQFDRADSEHTKQGCHAEVPHVIATVETVANAASR
jgi:hypothetical protein